MFSRVAWATVYHFYVWQPVTISGVGASAQASCRNRESVPVAPPAAQADILDGHFDSPEPRPSLVHARPSELQQKLGEIKSRLDGLGTLPRVPGQRARPHANPLLPRHQSRGLSDLLPRVGNKVDGGSRSAIRGSSADLLPDLTEPQSVGKVSGGGDEGVESFMRALVRALRGGVSKEQVGVDDDEFFDSEGFHEASPRASSNLLVRSRRLPGRLLAEALSSMRSFLGSREEAEISDQPRVLAYLETVFNQRYGKDAVGLRTSREMRTTADSIDALMEGDVLRAGDLLIQRFKALETSVIDGTWARARHHELIPEEGVGLASAEERQAISRLELQRRKLAEAVSRK